MMTLTLLLLLLPAAALAAQPEADDGPQSMRRVAERLAAGATSEPPAVGPGAPLAIRGAPSASELAWRRARSLRVLQERVTADGASSESAERARRLLYAMLERADPAVVSNLAERLDRLAVIPKDGKLTDLPDFAHLAGKTTMDGRPWESVRGAAASRGPRVVLAVAEESLLGPAEGRRPLDNYVLVHEIGHLVHWSLSAHAEAAVEPSSWRRLREALRAVAEVPSADLGGGDEARRRSVFAAAMRASWAPVSTEKVLDVYHGLKPEGEAALSRYSDLSEGEFFAEATTAYFDTGFEDGRRNDLDRLSRLRPELAELMFRVYGPARSLRD